MFRLDQRGVCERGKFRSLLDERERCVVEGNRGCLCLMREGCVRERNRGCFVG